MKLAKLFKSAAVTGGALLVAKGLDNLLETTHYTIASDKIPAEFDGFHIVQISDLHASAVPGLIAEVKKFSTSSLITRTTNDAFQVMQFTNTILRMAMICPVMFIISLFMILNTSVKLSGILVVTLPLIVLGVVLIAKQSHPWSQTQQKNLDKLNRISRENLTGIRVIRAFGKDKYESERFDILLSYMTNRLKYKELVGSLM